MQLYMRNIFVLFDHDLRIYMGNLQRNDTLDQKNRAVMMNGTLLHRGVIFMHTWIRTKMLRIYSWNLQKSDTRAKHDIAWQLTLLLYLNAAM